MALPLKILAYASHMKTKCVIRNACKLSKNKIGMHSSKKTQIVKIDFTKLSVCKKKIKKTIYVI